MSKSSCLLVLALLMAGHAAAATYLLDVTGVVASRDGTGPSDMAAVAPGDRIHAQWLVDTRVGVLEGDGATYLQLGGAGIRARLSINGKPFVVESGPFNGGQLLQQDASVGVIPLWPTTDVFRLAHVTADNNFFADAAIPSASIRMLMPLLLAPGESNLVTLPVTAFGSGLNPATAALKVGMLYIGPAYHTAPGTLEWTTRGGATAYFSLDTFIWSRCEHSMAWIAALQPWPSGELECR